MNSSLPDVINKCVLEDMYFQYFQYTLQLFVRIGNYFR